MADTVNIPGLGPTKKSTAYILGGAAVLVVIVAWYRSRNAPASSSTSSSSTGAGGSGDAIDPATGYVYGSAEDTAALGSQGSYLGAGYYGGNGSNVSTISTTNGYTTNAQWSQAAEDYLVNTVGADANTVGNALGKYITGQALTPDQVGIVNQAIAFTGYPPQNGPTGYPPSYKTSNEPPPATTPTGPPAAVTGLKGTAYREHVDLTWNAVPQVAGYIIYADGIRKTNNVYTNEHVWNLKPNTVHRLEVQPFRIVNGQEVTGPKTGISIRTKK
ncbi:hypothetical protein GCM10009527_098290 [Actinomadura nitritigenes]|uniref:Fibronectin type-III domain-containing protein n=1 Tax=Actinomadura nitritigenes TaxID=134602 RepID=A0ABS3QWC7_9ACTN|nr:hypothetical protein [Actinomadura nitritigenes]MBO2438274.1 hypothetical protein [Actinomadura nitritigenes]